MSDPVLGLKGVSLRDPDLPPLAATDLDAAVGEHVALIEAGDGGALTAMRIAAGFSAPDVGRVIFAGRDLTDRPPAERPSRWVATGLGLFAAVSVLDNLADALDAPDLGRRARRALALDLLDRHGLAALAGRMPRTLDPTEATRIALLRALAGAPAVLLLDRPFLGVPVRERRALRDAFAAMRRDRPVAVVERCDDPGEALAEADRIALFDRDRLVQFDTPDRVWANPPSLAAARLTGAVDVVPGRLLARDGDRGRVETALGVFVGTLAEALAPGDAAVVAFRPEHVDLADVDPPRSDALVNRFDADFVERRFEGGLVRLVFAAAGRPIGLVRCDRGARRHLLAGRTGLAVAVDDVRIHAPEGRPS